MRVGNGLAARGLGLPVRLLLLSLLLLPSVASAQGFKNAIERMVEPSAPFAPAVERTMREHQVGGLSLREHLVSLDFEGCLQDARAELVDGLGKLRALHVVATEDRKLTAIWKVWDRKLEGLSPDAWLLVTTWLDSPETAARLYLCDDGLPASWKGLGPDQFVVEAITWFDLAVADQERALRGPVPADREQAVMTLIEVRQGLLDRFSSTYPGDAPNGEARARLDDRLGMMWESLVDPYHFGFTARGRVDDPLADSSGSGRYQGQNPFGSGGVGIPDPRDVAARDKVARSWKVQQKIVDQEIAERQAELDYATAAIEAATDDQQLDRAVRYASRVDSELGQLVSDLERMQNRVRYFSTGRSWVDDMLSNGYRRRAVRRLARREKKALVVRDEAESVIAEAVARGATPPGQIRPGAPGTVGGGSIATGKPGPGNWLAGLPGAAEGGSTVATNDEGGIPPGTGWVERTYEGPLPSPSAVWSQDLVDAIKRRHDSLDETDIRILLGLVRAAYSELPNRAAVEQAVWRSLTEGDGLNIRGEESTLSDLYVPGAGRADQPIITFVLTLNF